jgi:hypothetical protein
MTPYNPTADFLSTDAAALASHMRSCANKKSKFFVLQVGMERLHSLIFPRLLTLLIVTALLIAATSIV